MTRRIVVRVVIAVAIVLMVPHVPTSAQATSGCDKMLADDLERANSDLQSCVSSSGGSQAGQNIAACYGVYGTKVGLAYAGYAICKSAR